MQRDVEHFSRHARRSIVQVDDVRLCARRNADLLHSLDALISAQLKVLPKKRKTVIAKDKSEPSGEGNDWLQGNQENQAPVHLD